MVGRTVGILVLLACSANAQAFRCGHNIVANGDSTEKVLEKCGPPAHQNGNRWYYQLESGYLVREVRFGGGSVQQIRTLRPGT